MMSLPVCRHHKKAVRGVAYHRLYPLFASASDDGSVIVCHGTVYKYYAHYYTLLHTVLLKVLQ